MTEGKIEKISIGFYLPSIPNCYACICMCMCVYTYQCRMDMSLFEKDPEGSDPPLPMAISLLSAPLPTVLENNAIGSLYT